MRIMYTRANLGVRHFSFVISGLFHRAAQRTVGNHQFLRSAEEGDSVNPFNHRGLLRLHIVIFRIVQLNSISALRPRADIRLVWR